MKKNKVLLIVLACVAVPTVILGIILGVRTFSGDKDTDSTVSIGSEDEPTSTADGSVATDADGKEVADIKGSVDKETKETKDSKDSKETKETKETDKDGKVVETTKESSTGSTTTTETTKSGTTTTPTKPDVPPETEEGELIIVEPDQPTPTPTKKPSSGTKPTDKPSGGTKPTSEPTSKPTTAPTSSTEETEMGPIELPFVPAEDL